MERFAIKINETLRKSMYNICRLCGIDNPIKIPLFEEVIIECEMDGLDIEPDFCNKILLCVGIEVAKNDNMPSMVCSLCADKINDFYEFREMCKTTNTQTRLLLGLPPEEKDNFQDEILKRKKRKFGDDEFTENSKTCNNQIKKIKNDIVSESTTSSRTRNSTQILKKQSESLLEIKIPNAREREDLRRRGRKIKNELIRVQPITALVKKVLKGETPPPDKYIEKVLKISCKICKKKFISMEDHKIHLETIHIPKVYDFGCIACKMSFTTAKDHKDHHCWHKSSGTPYICFQCSKSHDNRTALAKHFSIHRKEISANFIMKPNVKCDKCNKVFLTENLYDWHKCFIKTNGTCRKCNRQISKKAHLFKHFIKCEGNGIEVEKNLAKQNAEINSCIFKSMKTQTVIKSEPEYTTSEIDKDCYVVTPEIGNQPIFTIMPLNNIKNEPPDIYQDLSDTATNILEPNILIKTEPNNLFEYPQFAQATTISSSTFITSIKQEKMDNLENISRSNIISNIKKESYNEVISQRTTAGAGTLKLKIKKEHGTLNASFVNKAVINPLAKRNKKNKKNKIYKKPFELTIKIKQEILDRDSQVGDMNSNDTQNINDFDDKIIQGLPHEISTVTENAFDNIQLPIISEIFSNDFGTSTNSASNKNNIQVPIIASVESGVTMPSLNITNNSMTMSTIIKKISLSSVKTEITKPDINTINNNDKSKVKIDCLEILTNAACDTAKDSEKEDDVTIIEHNHDVIVLDDDEGENDKEEKNIQKKYINENKDEELKNKNQHIDTNNTDFPSLVLTSVRSLSDNIEVVIPIEESINLDRISANDLSVKEIKLPNISVPSTDNKMVTFDKNDSVDNLENNCDSNNEKRNIAVSSETALQTFIQKPDEDDSILNNFYEYSIEENRTNIESQVEYKIVEMKDKDENNKINDIQDEGILFAKTIEIEKNTLIKANVETYSNEESRKEVDIQDEDTLLENENKLPDDVLLDFKTNDNDKCGTPLVDALEKITMDTITAIPDEKDLKGEIFTKQNLKQNTKLTSENLEGISNMLDDISDDEDDDQVQIDLELEKKLLEDLSDEDNKNVKQNSNNKDNSKLILENREK